MHADHSGQLLLAEIEAVLAQLVAYRQEKPSNPLFYPMPDGAVDFGLQRGFAMSGGVQTDGKYAWPLDDQLPQAGGGHHHPFAFGKGRCRMPCRPTGQGGRQTDDTASTDKGSHGAFAVGRLYRSLDEATLDKKGAGRFVANEEKAFSTSQSNGPPCLPEGKAIFGGQAGPKVLKRVGG